MLLPFYDFWLVIEANFMVMAIYLVYWEDVYTEYFVRSTWFNHSCRVGGFFHSESTCVYLVFTVSSLLGSICNSISLHCAYIWRKMPRALPFMI
jgi:hypothetical protein